MIITCKIIDYGNVRKKFIYFILILFLLNSVSPAGGEDGKNLLQEGDLYYKQNRLDLAEETYEKALNIYLQNKDTDGMSMAYFRLGKVYLSLCLYDNSLNAYAKTFDLCKELNNQSLEAESLLKMGEVYLLLGSYEKGLKAYLTSLEIYKELNDTYGQGVSFEHTGDVYNELALYDSSIDYYEKALQSFREINEEGKIALVLCKMGEIYFTSGKKEVGLDKFQNALNIAENNPLIGYDILVRTAEICRDYENYDISLAMYEEARKLSKEQGDGNKEIQALLGLGRVYLLSGDDEKALGIYEKIIKLSEERGDNKARIDAVFNSAKIFERHFHSEKSLEMYKECLNFYEKAGDRWNVIQTEQELGKMCENTGNNEEAEMYYTESIKKLEEIRGEIKIEEFKESFSEIVIPMYKRVINFFLKTGKDKEAFNYLEMARARALLDVLTRAKVDIKQGADPELLEKDKKLQAEINFLQNALVEESSLSSPDGDYLRELEEKLDIAEKEAKIVRQELILSSPSYAFLTGIKAPLTVDEIQAKVLKENQFLLEYFINGETLIVWITGKNSFSIKEIPVSEETLREKIDLFRKPLESLKEETVNFNEILAGFDPSVMKDLYNILFKPVRDSVNFPLNSEIIIVPDGILYTIPFEALISGEKNIEVNEDILFSGFLKNKYLIEEYNITYIPSASSLDPDLQIKEKEPSGLFLGFGNPSFSLSPETEDYEAEILGSFVRLQGGNEYYLPELPQTEIQVKNIEKLFEGSGNTEIYLQEKATEEMVKSNSSGYKYLLFATHGLLNEKNPMYSSLVFTLGKSSSEDGFLRAMEILNMDLKADLVVLSACETGLGKINSGEGVIGLTRAFMYGGASSIAVSLWSVESNSTAKFMEIFYKNLISGMNKGEALRQAKIQFMNENEIVEGKEISYSHPFFWAPFVMVGVNN